MSRRSCARTAPAGLRAGRLHLGSLARYAGGSDAVFARRTVRDGVDTAVVLALDLSSSLGSDFDPNAGFSTGSIGGSTVGAGFIRSGRWCHPPNWPQS